MKIIRFIAGFVGVYHIASGLLGTLSGNLAAELGRILFNARVDVTPQFSYMAKYLGAYVIAFGAMMLFIAQDPVKYRGLINVAVLLICIRIIDRIVFAAELKNAFGIELTQSIVTISIIGLVGLSLLIFKPKVG